MIQKKEDTTPFPAITELLQVDSTNNYALAKIREGLAYHGLCVFAHEQLAGRGQRGKKWVTAPGQNIHLSVVLEPKLLKLDNLFALSALVAVKTREFMAEKAAGNWLIKWPNDIYFQDRKAGGILIENILSGQNWKWAVVGIGLNINEEAFPAELNRAVSLRQISGKSYDCLELAKELGTLIMKGFDELEKNLLEGIQMNLSAFNQHLFKKEQEIQFEKEGLESRGKVVGVNARGQLLINNEAYDFGEIKWIL